MRPWSFSRLSTAEECLAQYKYSYLDRLLSSRPPSPAANRGKAIHSKAEDYLLGKVSIYPAELQKVASHAMKLKSLHAIPEKKYALLEDLTPTEFDDPKAFVRGILDVTYTSNEGKRVHIQDWKTGQVYADHPKQLETYVALVAPFFPDAEEFETRLIYIDQGTIPEPRIVSKARASGMQIMLKERILTVEKETIFPVKPGQHCRFCNYSKRFGGPCAH